MMLNDLFLIMRMFPGLFRIKELFNLDYKTIVRLIERAKKRERHEIEILQFLLPKEYLKEL